jgi:hypothetical protein
MSDPSDASKRPDSNVGGGQTIQLQEKRIGGSDQPGGGVVTQRHLLSFGRNVLAVLVCLMVMASWVYLWSDKDHLQTGKDIFEFAKITLPPIATLIIGFYFRGNHGTE